MRKIILASESPRRRLLLQQLGLEFKCSPAHITEDLSASVPPPELARNIAVEKAQQIARGLNEEIVIAADTVVTLEGKVMGKPASRDEACYMLSCLSGRCHQVITGICVIDTIDKIVESGFETTDVFFRSLSSHEINNYLNHGEWGDKAGAYAIQGRGALLIDHIQGCYFNVVGLPLNRLNLMLRPKGLDLLEVS